MRAAPSELEESVSHRYLLAIMLHGQVESRLQGLRQAYDIPAWEPRIGLHITLLRPFWSDLSIRELARRVHFFTHQHHPFTLELKGLGRFDNEEDESVLYVQVTPNAALSGLHQDLRQNLEYLTGPSDRPGFIAHVSISDQTTKAMVNSYMAKLGDEQVWDTMDCNHFSLLRKDKDQGWRVVHGFNLW
jgi:2'-5' RNA ligase